MTAPDPLLPVVFDHAQAVAAGLTASQARRRAANRWDRLQRGCFTAAPLEAEHRWRAEVLAAVRANVRPIVLSHTSAARAWRLPAPRGGWGPTSFTAREGRVRRRAGGLVLVAELAPSDVTLVGPVLVTSPARTVVDCARRLPPPDALAIADAALRRGLVDAAALSEVLERQRGWPGAARAARVLALADGRRESPLESWSAWAFAVEGLPAPVWQVTVLDETGVFLGRVDGWWSPGVAGEADGALKYRLAAAERAGALADGLVAVTDDERRREQGFRRAGVVIVRWGAVDVLDAVRRRALAGVLREEFARSSGSRFRGRALLL